MQKESQVAENQIKAEENKPKQEVSAIHSDKTAFKPNNKAEIYRNGSLSLNKILLSNGEFILADPNSSAPYGIFKPSTKKDTYRVQLQDGTTTLGYMEDGKIVIEKTNSDGSLRTEVFEMK